MKSFNEFAMVSALCYREADAREIRKIFNPDWLTQVELQPVLRAIFDYMDSEKTPPSIESLSQYMAERDQAKFDARWKATIEQLRNIDTKLHMYNVERAKEAAAAASLQHLVQEDRFQKMMESGNADALRAEVSVWLSKHKDSEDEGLVSIQEAFDGLIDSQPWQGRLPKIGTGIKPIDKWYGGIRDPQLGIIMAPSGHGKSALLMNMARYAAAIENRVVLFVTNEMTINEQTERFLVRMQEPQIDAAGKSSFVTLDQIQDDPVTAYLKLEGHQKELDNHLYIYSAALGQNVVELEEVMSRLRDERGTWPDLVVVDYIERMDTHVKMDKGKTWTYLGQIAKELVWLNKRRHWAMWTAIQTNRGGMNAKAELGMDSAQGSIQHIQEAALVIGVKRVVVTLADGTQEVCLLFNEQKARHGAMEGRTMLVKTDLSRMYVSDIEIESVTDIEDVEPEGSEPPKKKKVKSQFQVKVGGKS